MLAALSMPLTQMSLEIVLGPMFAGKSSYILSMIRRYEAIGYPVLSITNKLDIRYDISSKSIHSHNHETSPAIPVLALAEILSLEEFKGAKLVVIEEAQFYPDLKDTVLKIVEEFQKDVLVVGLDGDAERYPFGEILYLIPFCDKVTKLTALCKFCGDLTPAIFTHRKEKSFEQIQIGEADIYEAVCRKHYLLKGFGR